MGGLHDVTPYLDLLVDVVIVAWFVIDVISRVRGTH
jgi:hypothetical protein